MPFIKTVEVQNLAGRLDPVHCQLDRHVNVFFGSNGSGKTSLLKLLHSGLSSDSRQLAKSSATYARLKIEEVPLDHPEWLVEEQTITRTLKDREEERSWRTAASLLGSTDPLPKKVWFSDSNIEGSEDSGQVISHIYLPISRLYATDDYRFSGILGRVANVSTRISEADLDKIFVESINHLWLRYTRNVLADVRGTQDQGYRNILLNLLSPSGLDTEAPPIKDPQLAYQRLLSFVNRQETYIFDIFDEDDFIRKLSQNSLMRQVVAEIERVERIVERTQRPRAQFESLIREMIGGRKHIELGDRDIVVKDDKEDDIGLDSLSSGERQLLRIYLEALFAGDKPIIIDEPELSMHIDWQRKFIQALRKLSPDSQIIIATHSPEIMADLDERSIFEL